MTCTMIVSLVAATKPLQAREASKLLCDVASACQMLVKMTRKPKIIEIGRRPKILESGTIKIFANPSVMTFKPVKSESCDWSRRNRAPRSGNIGAMESAEETRTHT